MKCYSKSCPTPAASSSPPPSSTQLGNSVGLLTVFAILTLGLTTLNAGCTLNGFRNIPTGQPTTPTELRSAAAIARAEAVALEEIADQREGQLERFMDSAQQAAEGLGAPAVLTGLLGAAGGFLVPSPSQRRRERLAAQEASLAASGQPQKPEA